MKRNRGSGFALLLVVCGALILLGKIGHGFGHGHGLGHLFGWMMGLLVPIAMIGFGYLGLVNGRKVIGAVLMVVGAIMLLGQLSGLIGLIIAIGMIVYGLSMLKRTNVH